MNYRTPTRRSPLMGDHVLPYDNAITPVQPRVARNARALQVPGQPPQRPGFTGNAPPQNVTPPAQDLAKPGMGAKPVPAMKPRADVDRGQRQRPGGSITLPRPPRY